MGLKSKSEKKNIGIKRGTLSRKLKNRRACPSALLQALLLETQNVWHVRKRRESRHEPEQTTSLQRTMSI